MTDVNINNVVAHADVGAKIDIKVDATKEWTGSYVPSPPVLGCGWAPHKVGNYVSNFSRSRAFQAHRVQEERTDLSWQGGLHVRFLLSVLHHFSRYGRQFALVGVSNGRSEGAERSSYSTALEQVGLYASVCCCLQGLRRYP